MLPVDAPARRRQRRTGRDRARGSRAPLGVVHLTACRCPARSSPLCVGWPDAPPPPATPGAAARGAHARPRRRMADLRTPVRATRAVAARIPGASSSPPVTRPLRARQRPLHVLAKDALAALLPAAARACRPTRHTPFHPTRAPAAAPGAAGRGRRRRDGRRGRGDATIDDVRRQLIGDAIAAVDPVGAGSRTARPAQRRRHRERPTRSAARCPYVPGVRVSGPMHCERGSPPSSSSPARAAARGKDSRSTADRYRPRLLGGRQVQARLRDRVVGGPHAAPGPGASRSRRSRTRRSAPPAEPWPTRSPTRRRPYLLQHARQPGRLAAVGRGGAGPRARATGRCWSRSATRPATGATSWSASPSRTPTTAALMNERFVCVKVDREERPDVDAIYMEAVQAMTGHGGWPLNVFLTPDQVPFYGGTYFPPEPRHGMPAWRAGARGGRRGWRERSATRSSSSGARWRARLARRRARCEPPTSRSTAAARRRRSRALRATSTRATAASGGAPKFPPSSRDRVPARAAARREMAAAHAAARWPRGGIYDQVGGGFARYASTRPGRARTSRRCSTTTRCSPRAYLHGWQLDRRPAPAARRRGDPRLGAARDARRPRAASSARWTPTPRASRASSTCGRSTSCARRSATGRRRRDRLVRRHRRAATSRGPPNVLRVARPRAAARAAPAHPRRGCWRPAPRACGPGLDDKRLTAWNALMIARARRRRRGAGPPGLPRRRARGAPSSCSAPARRRGPPAAHLERRRRRSSHAYLEDHAFLLEALLALYEATFDPRWFAEARDAGRRDPRALRRRRARRLLRHRRRRTSALVARRKDLEDAPIPSGCVVGRARPAAAGARSPARRATRRPRSRTCGSSRARCAPHPQAFAHPLQALDLHLGARARGRAGRREPTASRRSPPSCRGAAPAPCCRRLGPGRRATAPLLRAARAGRRAAPPPTSASASPAGARSPRRRTSSRETARTRLAHAGIVTVGIDEPPPRVAGRPRAKWVVLARLARRRVRRRRPPTCPASSPTPRRTSRPRSCPATPSRPRRWRRRSSSRAGERADDGRRLPPRRRPDRRRPAAHRRRPPSLNAACSSPADTSRSPPPRFSPDGTPAL